MKSVAPPYRRRLEPPAVRPVALIVGDPGLDLLHLVDEAGQVLRHLLENAPALLHAGIAQRIADGGRVGILVVVHRHEDVLRVAEDHRAHSIALAERRPHPFRCMGAGGTSLSRAARRTASMVT